MTNGIFLSHLLVPNSRTALAAVRQCPIARCSAIHAHVIVVSPRTRVAIRAFFWSPLLRSRNSDSFHPAARNVSRISRCAFCSPDSLSSLFSPDPFSAPFLRQHRLGFLRGAVGRGPVARPGFDRFA